MIIEGVRRNRVGQECDFTLDCPKGTTAHFDGDTLTIYREGDLWVKDPIGATTGGIIELGPQGGIGRVSADEVGGVADVILWRITQGD